MRTGSVKILLYIKNSEILRNVVPSLIWARETAKIKIQGQKLMMAEATPISLTIATTVTAVQLSLDHCFGTWLTDKN